MDKKDSIKIANVMVSILEPVEEIHEEICRTMGLTIHGSAAHAQYDLDGFIRGVLRVIEDKDAKKGKLLIHEVLEKYFMVEQIDHLIQFAIEKIKPVIIENVLRYKPPYCVTYTYDLLTSKFYNLVLCFYNQKGEDQNERHTPDEGNTERIRKRA